MAARESAIADLKARKARGEKLIDLEEIALEQHQEEQAQKNGSSTLHQK